MFNKILAVGIFIFALIQPTFAVESDYEAITKLATWERQIKAGGKVRDDEL